MRKVFLLILLTIGILSIAEVTLIPAAGNLYRITRQPRAWKLEKLEDGNWKVTSEGAPYVLFLYSSKRLASEVGEVVTLRNIWEDMLEKMKEIQKGTVLGSIFLKVGKALFEAGILMALGDISDALLMPFFQISKNVKIFLDVSGASITMAAESLKALGEFIGMYDVSGYKNLTVALEYLKSEGRDVLNQEALKKFSKSLKRVGSCTDVLAGVTDIASLPLNEAQMVTYSYKISKFFKNLEACIESDTEARKVEDLSKETRLKIYATVGSIYITALYNLADLMYGDLVEITSIENLNDIETLSKLSIDYMAKKALYWEVYTEFLKFGKEIFGRKDSKIDERISNAKQEAFSAKVYFDHLQKLAGVASLPAKPFTKVKERKGPPDIEWQRALGGSGDDVAESIQQTRDGGYIVAGWTRSSGGSVSRNHGRGDFWIVKLDENGKYEWQRTLGGGYDDGAYSIQQTRDGGYIVAGGTLSNDGDVSGYHGSWDFWVVKLDREGNIEWQRALGGSKGDVAGSIQQTRDGGYIVAGWTESNDGDVSGNHGGKDFWVVKLDSEGDIEWQRALGGSCDDWAESIQQTNDGGYIVAGITYSNDGDVIGNYGERGFWVVKLDEEGNIEWQRVLGGSYNDEACSIQQTGDGGYIVAGGTASNDEDVSGNHGGWDFWVVKLDKDGNIEWQKCLGGSDDERAASIQQTRDGGYIVAGSTNHGGWDFWVVKLGWKESSHSSVEEEASGPKIETQPGGSAGKEGEEELYTLIAVVSTPMSQVYNVFVEKDTYLILEGEGIRKEKYLGKLSGATPEEVIFEGVPEGTYTLILKWGDKIFKKPISVPEDLHVEFMITL